MNDHLSAQIKVQELVKLLKIVGVFVLVAAALFGIFHWREEDRRETALKAYEALFDVEAMEDKALKEAALLSANPLEVFMAWPETKKAEYLDKLSEIQRKYPETSAAASAGLKIGRWYVEEKHFEKAATAFQGVYEGKAAKSYPLFAAIALEGWGAALEASNKNAEALDVFEKFLKLSKNPLKPLAYMGRARNLKAVGQLEDARRTYESVIAEFPSSPYEKKARVLMETLSL